MSTAPVPQPAPPPAPRAAGRGRRIAIGAAVVLLGTGVSIAVGLGILWNSDTAMQRLIRMAPGVEATGLSGRPTGGPFAVQRLVWRGGGTVVTVDDLAWRGADWRWRPHRGAWAGLTLDGLRVARVTVTTTPAADEPPAEKLAAPADLRLPVAFEAMGVTLGELRFNDLAPVTALSADVQVGANAGAEHRLRWGATWVPYATDGRLVVGADGQMPVDATARVTSDAQAGFGWRADATATGPLARIGVDATLQGDGDMSATVRAAATPFAAFPLAALDVQARAVDLKRFAATLPSTQLDGTATLRDGASAQSLALDLDFGNSAAGPWDDGRLPLRKLLGAVRVSPGDTMRIDLERLQADLGHTASGGRLVGTGQWAGRTLNAKVEADAIAANQLDRRAPQMTIGGPITATLDGLAAPGGAAPAAGSASDALRGTLDVALAGRIASPSQPWKLDTRAAFSRSDDGALTATLDKLDATAGAARASGTGRAARTADGAWTVASRGTLDRLDPGVWWPALTSRRDTRLDGAWDADLQLPAPTASAAPAASATASAAAASSPAMAPLTAVRGRANVQLKDSRLAGVPLRAEVKLDATAPDLKVLAEVVADGNRLQADGRQLRDLKQAQWQLAVDAPALDRLDPWAAWAPQVAAWVPTAGSVKVDAQVRGAWPALKTDGRLAARGVRAKAYGLDDATGAWSWSGLAADAPVKVELAANGLSQGEVRIDRLQADVDGSLRAHRFSLDVRSPLQPPAWTDALLKRDTTAALGPERGSVLSLRGDGRWQLGADAGTWQATLAELRAAPAAANAASWVSARALDARVVVANDGALRSARLAPGAVSAFGGDIRWQQAEFEAARAGSDARFAVDANLSPMRIAPLLAALQPEFDWRGDLALEGHVKLRRAETFAADVLVARQGGDLQARLGGATQSLGLTALRVSAKADRGRWELREELAGKQIGTLSGTQTATTSPTAIAPDADTAVTGRVDLRAADLAVWSPLLPAGWRVGGVLQAQATIGGRLGQPDLGGKVTGDALQVSNLFQGIYLTEGTLRAGLAADRVRIEQLQFRGGGSGTFSAQGDVRLGEKPQADVQVKAEKFRALNRFDRQVTISGDATIASRGERLAVQGRFDVDEGLIDISQSDAPSLDGDVRVIEPGATPVAEPKDKAPTGPTPGALAGLDVDLRVGLGNALRVSGLGLGARLAGDLRVRAPEGTLAVNGNVRVVDGTFAAYGQNLVVDRGVIQFRGDATNPRLDIVAVRPDIDQRVGVIVSGNAVDPRIRLYSEPELPEMEQLTWLLLGRAPEGVGRDDTALLQRAALAMLAGDKGGGDGGFIKKLGLDELSLRRGESGDAQDTVVALGKQVSKRLFIGYEKALSAAGGSWQLIYRIAGKYSLRAQAGEDSAIDAIRTWRWN